MADNNNPLGFSSQTDWSKCCLCQTDKKEELKAPPTLYECNPQSSRYYMIARNVPHFKDINQMPIRLDLSRLDDGCGIEETLRKNNAKYHQSCHSLFSNSKLERAEKRPADKQNDISERQSKVRRTTLMPQHCFLCDKVEPASELRQAMTMQLNDRLNECAHNLN